MAHRYSVRTAPLLAALPVVHVHVQVYMWAVCVQDMQVHVGFLCIYMCAYVWYMYSCVRVCAMGVVPCMCYEMYRA